MEAIYMGEENRKSSIGDVVMITGNVRCVVIDVQGTFVKVLGIGTKLGTGETFVLSRASYRNFPPVNAPI